MWFPVEQVHRAAWIIKRICNFLVKCEHINTVLLGLSREYTIIWINVNISTHYILFKGINNGLKPVQAGSSIIIICLYGHPVLIYRSCQTNHIFFVAQNVLHQNKTKIISFQKNWFLTMNEKKTLKFCLTPPPHGIAPWTRSRLCYVT